MNDSSTPAAPSTTSSTPAPSDQPAAIASAKAASKAETTSKIPVKAPRKSATPATKRKPVEAAAAPVSEPASPAAPAKAKTTPAKAQQSKASDKKKPAAPVKAAKDKKVKVVRDSFTLPKTELLQLNEMKKRAMALGVEVKKSELIRAGLQALASMADAGFKKAMANVPTIKTGRPAKD